MSPQGWQTIALTATQLGVSRQAVYKHIAKHRLPTWKVSPGKTLIQVEDVERWWAERSHIELPV